MVSTFILPGAIVLLTLVSGVWLSRSGKPLNTAIFTVHKLAALAAVITTAIQANHAFSTAHAPAVLVALFVAAGVGVVALFVTGALMSMNKPAYGILLTIHKVAPFVAVITTALAIYLLTGRPA